MDWQLPIVSVLEAVSGEVLGLAIWYLRALRSWIAALWAKGDERGVVSSPEALSEPKLREFVDNPRLDVVKTKNSKRKIVEKESPPVSTGVGDIVEIRKIGYSKINVQLKSREAANNLVTNPILKAKKYKVFIPLYRTTRRGIIRNVPLDLSKEEIRREIDSEVVVSSIKRLNRRKRNSDSSLSDVVDSDSRLTPSNTVLVTFRGQILPSITWHLLCGSCKLHNKKKEIF
ncbi:hypothetical protein RF55_11020 [Lasius niger]|uniref:Uncharacterized protein n=1 Tax=Lasius niger TaxID=67767 RepID=A0A0J7KGJ3_LASNI|nr:hypothetical protein RF55_11020 [Lasius niger]